MCWTGELSIFLDRVQSHPKLYSCPNVSDLSPDLDGRAGTEICQVEKKGNNGQDQKRLLGKMPESTTSPSLCSSHPSGAGKGTVRDRPGRTSTERRGDTSRHNHHLEGTMKKWRLSVPAPAFTKDIAVSARQGCLGTNPTIS